jgi:hypothetical protein
VRRDATNAIVRAVQDGYNAVYPDAPLALDDLAFTSVNRIPPARGLGSSSAALVSGGDLPTQGRAKCCTSPPTHQPPESLTRVVRRVHRRARQFKGFRHATD